jgi:hypothetical protein
MGDEMGTNKTPNDPVKEQIAQDKFGGCCAEPAV